VPGAETPAKTPPPLIWGVGRTRVSRQFGAPDVIQAARMKLRSDARVLKGKALSSMMASLRAFNDFGDEGRVTTVLLRTEHAFEMLLKAALVEQRADVFDKKTGKSISLDMAINRARDDKKIRLREGEAGLIRVLAELRDAEQHWYVSVPEGTLYMHMRGAVTTFGDVLQRSFGERLANHLPHRVMPIGTDVPRDFQFLVDQQFDNVAALLKPGRRAGTEARGQIRTLLAMEAHADEDTEVTEKDVDRVYSAIRQGKTRGQVFPKLATIGANVAGEGVELQVRFVKHDGLPVRFVPEGATEDAAAIRTVDLNKKFHLTSATIAKTLKLTPPRALALRRHLGIAEDVNMAHTFKLGAVESTRYSDNAMNAMKRGLAEVDMDAVWRAHRPAHRGVTLATCTQPGCAAKGERLALKAVNA